MPAPPTGFPAGQAALLLAACAFAGLAVLAGYLIARQRWHSRGGGAARAVPLLGFLFSVGGVGLALLAVAERKTAVLTPLHNLPGGHELIAIGAPGAAIITALACGSWSLMLLARWTVDGLVHRSSTTVRV